MTHIAQAKAAAQLIIAYIRDGMSELDAVILADISQDDYVTLRKNYPKVAVVIDKAKIEYKHKIIAKMNSLAATGDIKAMNWVAENSPAFAGDGKRGKEDGSVNPLKEAFRFIQDNSRPPVKVSKR